MKSFRLFLFVFAMFIFCSNAHAQYWCGQALTPGAPPPPPPPCDCPGPGGGGSGPGGSGGNPDMTASPAYIATGNYTTSATDLQLPTRGLPLTLNRTYDSVRLVDGPFGLGWGSTLTGGLTETTYLFSAPSTYYKEVVILMPSGRPHRFRENPDGSYTPPRSGYNLVKTPQGTFELTWPPGRMKYVYSSTGLLTQQVDEFGNALNFTRNPDGSVQRVSDGTGSGRYLEFLYGPDGRISTLQDSTGRSVSYVYNAQGALTTVTDAASKQTQYGYIDGRFVPLLNQIKDHWNRVITNVTYDTQDRVTTYTEAGDTQNYVYKYQGDPSKVSKTDYSGYMWVFTFDSNGLVTSRVPPSGQGGGTITKHFNADQSLDYSIDETGIKTSYTYNPNSSVATITRDDQGAQAVRFDYTYDATFPGKVISITPKNPSTSAVDPNWQAWRYDYYQIPSTAPGALYHVYRVRDDGVTLDTLATYTYNSAGQVLTVTDATGGVTTYAYNATSGDLTSVTYPKNSDTGANPVYTYGRDSLGRVIWVKVPGNFQTTYTYDNLDRIA
ncbi:DUF6531 domain-containing protein, partial [bacterium]|nr:DUF6531 domain-containing protein [bacterium]